MTTDPLKHLDETQVRRELRGFPAGTVDAVLALKLGATEELLRQAILGILVFYLPRGVLRDLASQPPSARLREDLGVDSLTLSEAAFKVEDLFAFRIENADLAGIETIGELMEYAKTKLLVETVVHS